MFSKEFDDSLEKIEIFQKYPEMLPAIGENYSSDQHKKILIVGENHFLPENTTIQHDDVKGWYAGNNGRLNDKERGWIWTRDIIESNGYDQVWMNGHHRFLGEIETAMLEANVPKSRNLFREVAFTNFFRRPAKEGKTIEEQEQDNEVAVDTLLKITEIIRPDAILFVSQKAHEIANQRGFREKSGKITNDYAPHPTSKGGYWRIVCESYGNITGKEKFIRFFNNNFWQEEKS